MRERDTGLDYKLKAEIIYKILDHIFQITQRVTTHPLNSMVVILYIGNSVGGGSYIMCKGLEETSRKLQRL